MNLQTCYKKISAMAAMAALTLACMASAKAGTVSQTPLFLSNAAEPNIILGIDDSGSMDFEVLFYTNDGAIWWNTTNQSFVGCDVNDNCSNTTASDTFNFNAKGNFGNSGPWLKYAYLFPFPGVHLRNSGYNSISAQGHYFVPPLPQYAWARSSDYNNAYFNPTVTYTPWVNSDGTPVFAGTDGKGDISPTAAPDDPFLYASTTIDLTSEMGGAAGTTKAPNWPGFMMQQGMTLPAGAVVWNPNGNSGTGVWQPIIVPDPIPDNTFKNGTYVVGTNPDGTAAQYLQIAYFPATFWLNASDTATLAALTSPTGYGYLATAEIIGGLGPNNEPMIGFEIKPLNFASTAQYNAAIQNFANWFSYYRKRHLALRASLSQTFVSLSNMRVGMNYMDETPVNGKFVMYDMNSASQKASFFQDFLNDKGSGGTPTWQLLNSIGQDYMSTGSGAPITQACQKNFAIIFTDGYADYPYPTSTSPVSGSNNVDGSMGSPYADSTPGTLADVASYYYLNNLRPDLTPGLVAPDPACGTSSPPPGLDCQTNLHMNTYAVTVVQQGSIWNNPSELQYTQNPYANPPPWPTASAFANRNPTGIDDLWHATLDSRGQMFAAQTPQLIAQQMQQVLSSIASRTSSAAAIATNSTRLDTNTFIYQARFQTTDWTGDLLAFKINPNGSVAANASWDAAQQIPSAVSRNIATWAPNATTSTTSVGSGEPFEWSDLTATQQAALNLNPTTGSADGLGADRVTWLRGGSVSSTDGFRTRSSPLGDIVNSNPLYVQDENFDYNDAPSYSNSACGGSSTSGTTTTGVNGQDVGAQCYSQYFVSQLNRTPVIYVGANDGMLHAFNATTGQELFAFVPNTVIPALNKLMAPNYSSQHQFYVDGSPTVGDAYNGTSWGTYLVGSTGAGGTGVFALNVTNPTSNTESNASSWVQWEINSSTSGFSDLGYTVPRASIALMANGQYAAIVSNGFDSSSGAAAVFIINLFSGQLIREIKVPGVTKDGLASAVPVDTTQPGDRVTNFIYAGDLQGNLWKFDVTSTNPANWCVSNNSGGCIKTSATSATPLFKAVDALGNPQPITVRPVVGLAQNGSPQIYFGTGKYFETGDNVVPSNPQVQTFYSIIDNGSGAVTRSQLLQQQILATTQVTENGSTDTVRVTTNNPTSSSPPGGPSAMTQPGWYMDLLSQPGATGSGEMVVSPAELDNGRIVFTTLIPNTNPCGFGGTSFLMELNAFTGSRLSGTPFDLNGDGHFDNGDYVTVTVTVSGQPQTITVPVSGMQSGVGIIQTPAIISASSVEYKFASGSTGQIMSVTESPPSGGGRQSWVQLR